MTSQDKFDGKPARTETSAQMDLFIRAGLILALVMLCYQVFAPFLTLMVWALILAVTLYPLHRALALQTDTPPKFQNFLCRRNELRRTILYVL